MSEAVAQTTPTQGGHGGGPTVGTLSDLVREMGRWRESPVANIVFVVISVSSALPESKRTPPLVEQIKDGVAAQAALRGGKAFTLSTCDFAILAKLPETAMIGTVRDLKVEMLRTFERHFPGSFGTIDQTRLVLSYELQGNYRSAADRIAKYAELANQESAKSAGDKKLRPLTPADIKNVMRAYEKFGSEKFIKTFVRSQEVCLAVDGRPPEPVMTEYFISMDLLRKPLFVDVEMRGSGRLFNEFTLVLDQILLQAFDSLKLGELRVSLNLNVESVFTEAFENFIERTPESTLQQVVFEFRQSNIVENFDEFQVARGLIRAKGAHIAVDQIFPQTVGLVDLDFLGASIAKIHWRNGAEEVLHEREKAITNLIAAGVLPVLIRVDQERALEVGNGMGITMYQGFLIDDMLKGDA
ncbi:MAG: hypothetical protein RIC29_08075 [Rhodospirillaceae bacterium]